MPGWQFTPGDRFFVADFNGDGRDDLYVFNGANWSIPYLGMMRSTGSGFGLVKRYDSTLPGWQMTTGDRFYPGDFTGDGSEGLYVANGADWSISYLGMLRPSGAGLTMVRRYDGQLPHWQMTPGDQYYTGDFDGDGRADLFVFNGTNWSIAYLGLLASNGTELKATVRYDGTVPGWQMRKNDDHRVAELNGRAGCSSTTGRTGAPSISAPWRRAVAGSASIGPRTGWASGTSADWTGWLHATTKALATAATSWFTTRTGSAHPRDANADAGSPLLPVDPQLPSRSELVR